MADIGDALIVGALGVGGYFLVRTMSQRQVGMGGAPVGVGDIATAPTKVVKGVPTAPVTEEKKKTLRAKISQLREQMQQKEINRVLEDTGKTVSGYQETVTELEQKVDEQKKELQKTVDDATKGIQEQVTQATKDISETVTTTTTGISVTPQTQIGKIGEQIQEGTEIFNKAVDRGQERMRKELPAGGVLSGIAEVGQAGIGTAGGVAGGIATGIDAVIRTGERVTGGISRGIETIGRLFG